MEPAEPRHAGMDFPVFVTSLFPRDDEFIQRATGGRSRFRRQFPDARGKSLFSENKGRQSC